MNSKNYNTEILDTLYEVLGKVPEKDLMSHLELACSEYDNLATVPNKELLHLLNEYSNLLDTEVVEDPLEEVFHYLEEYEEDDFFEEEDDFE